MGETVFRFLDPNGEGNISLKEWSVLEQFCNEITLSLREFVKVLERTFGNAPGLLERVWNVLDADGSESITPKEWDEVVKKKLSYFGPSATIYDILDKNDDASIGLLEFEALERFVASDI